MQAERAPGARLDRGGCLHVALAGCSVSATHWGARCWLIITVAVDTFWPRKATRSGEMKH